MHLGEATYNRAIGFLTRPASLASCREASAELVAGSESQFSATHGTALFARISEVERDPNSDDRDAIRDLEPLLAEVLDTVLSSGT